MLRVRLLLNLFFLAFCSIFCPAEAQDEAKANRQKDSSSSTIAKDPVLIYREAGATQEQEAKIRQLAQSYEKAAKVRLERLQGLSKQIKELSYQSELDEKLILALQDEMNQLQNLLNTERLKLLLSIRSLLAPETRVKLVDLLRAKDGLAPLARPADNSSGGNSSGADSSAENLAPQPSPEPLSEAK